MKITGAALVNRFYVRDGWTKEKVADLIVTPIDLSQRLNVVELRDTGDPLAYFAVYSVRVVFNRVMVKTLHEFVPFNRDEGFNVGNRWT